MPLAGASQSMLEAKLPPLSSSQASSLTPSVSYNSMYVSHLLPRFSVSILYALPAVAVNLAQSMSTTV